MKGITLGIDMRIMNPKLLQLEKRIYLSRLSAQNFMNR